MPIHTSTCLTRLSLTNAVILTDDLVAFGHAARKSISLNRASLEIGPMNLCN